MLKEKVSHSPLAFCQVREDPQLDIEILNSIPGNDLRVLMIASGGDTLCRLSTVPEVGHIDAVDANSAQLLLSKLKLQLMERPSNYRIQVLGYSPLDPAVRKSLLEYELGLVGGSLSELCVDKKIIEAGPDFCGRYERLFAGIQQSLGVTPEQLADECRRGISAEFQQRLKTAFDEYFDIELLVQLFGESATQNPRISFSDHFYERTLSFLKSPLAVASPFLFQMLTGSFYVDKYQWLQTNARIACEVNFYNTVMADFMKNCKKKYNFIHLSNILDWLSVDQAEELLQMAYSLLAQGGKVIIRQLNSSLDVESAGSFFKWQRNHLEKIDLSFFYREVHVGEKTC